MGFTTLLVWPKTSMFPGSSRSAVALPTIQLKVTLPPESTAVLFAVSVTVGGEFAYTVTLLVATWFPATVGVVAVIV